MVLVLLTLVGCSGSAKKTELTSVSMCVITKNKVMRALSAGAQVMPSDIEILTICYPKIGGPHAVFALTDLESGLARRLADQEVREVELIKILGEMRNPESIPVLFKIISTSPSVKVRAEATRSLGKIGGPLAILALQHQLKIESSLEVRKALQEAIKAIIEDGTSKT